jgi:hypothetical protein
MSLIELGQAAAALLAILSLIGLFVKWALIKPIKTYIDIATYPIHPNANGGKSLPDLVNSVNDLKYLVMSHLAEHDTPKK